MQSHYRGINVTCPRALLAGESGLQGVTHQHNGGWGMGAPTVLRQGARPNPRYDSHFRYTIRISEYNGVSPMTPILLDSLDIFAPLTTLINRVC